MAKKVVEGEPVYSRAGIWVQYYTEYPYAEHDGILVKETKKDFQVLVLVAEKPAKYALSEVFPRRYFLRYGSMASTKRKF